jgi:outer membrane protein assembly factor BamB
MVARWEYTPGPIAGYVTGGVFSSPALVEGVVYVGGLNGRLYALQE